MGDSGKGNYSSSTHKTAKAFQLPDFLKKYGLMFIVSGWMFFLGILVGRETMPVHFDVPSLRNELAVMKQETVEKQKQRIKEKLDIENNEPVFEYHEKLKDNDADTRIRAAAEIEKKKVDIDTSPAVESPLVKKSGLKKRLSNDRSDAAGQNTVEHPGKAEKSGHYISIQIASFKDIKAADQRVTLLKDKGFDAYRTAADIEGVVWHRVRIGRFRDKKEAKGTLDRLKSQNLTWFFVNSEN